MERKNYLIDTNITLYYFGMLLSKESENFLDEVLSSPYSISVINRIELLGNKGIGSKEQNALDAFINNAAVINIDEDIILETIQIRKKYAIKLPDALIAATCLVHHLHLITNNTRDFEKINGLNLIDVKLT